MSLIWWILLTLGVWEKGDFSVGMEENSYPYTWGDKYVYPTTPTTKFFYEKFKQKVSDDEGRNEGQFKGTFGGNLHGEFGGKIDSEGSNNNNKGTKKDQLGFYNVQTGDEFFLHDFDVRPRFKTKQHDRDVVEFEYYAPVKQKRPTFHQTTSRPTTRRPVTTKTTKKPSRTVRRKIQAPTKKRRRTTTTRRPLGTKIQGVRKRRPFNQTNNKQQLQGCTKNRVKKPVMMKNRNKLKKRPSSNNKNNRQRKMFALPTFEDIKNSTARFTNRLFSLFTIVQFDNFECSASGKFGEYRGICYSDVQCSKLGGTSTGACANGYGVCCIVRRTCGESSNQNLTYLESPGYPDLYPGGDSQEAFTEFQDEPTEEPSTESPDLSTESPDLPTETPDVERPEFSTEETDQIDLEDEEDSTGVLPFREPRQENIADSLACIFWVYKTTSSIKRMRIDFVDVELIGPTQNGDCTLERFVVSGQNIRAPLPIVCGYLTGQHYYVDVDGLTGPLQISILSTSVWSKRYKLLVTQVSTSCGSSINCLQQYDNVDGMFSSFNYEQSAIMRSSPRYMNNLNYAICIERQSGYCSVVYDVAGKTDENAFEIADSSSGEEEVEELAPERCPEDFIVLASRRICGGTFDGPVTDNSSGPIVISVRSDDGVVGRGFKLTFKQIECPTY